MPTFLWLVWIKKYCYCSPTNTGRDPPAGVLERATWYAPWYRSNGCCQRYIKKFGAPSQLALPPHSGTSILFKKILLVVANRVMINFRNKLKKNCYFSRSRIFVAHHELYTFYSQFAKRHYIVLFLKICPHDNYVLSVFTKNKVLRK